MRISLLRLRFATFRSPIHFIKKNIFGPKQGMGLWWGVGGDLRSIRGWVLRVCGLPQWVLSLLPQLAHGGWRFPRLRPVRGLAVGYHRGAAAAAMRGDKVVRGGEMKLAGRMVEAKADVAISACRSKCAGSYSGVPVSSRATFCRGPIGVVLSYACGRLQGRRQRAGAVADAARDMRAAADRPGLLPRWCHGPTGIECAAS